MFARVQTSNIRAQKATYSEREQLTTGPRYWAIWYESFYALEIFPWLNIPSLRSISKPISCVLSALNEFLRHSEGSRHKSVDTCERCNAFKETPECWLKLFTGLAEIGWKVQAPWAKIHFFWNYERTTCGDGSAPVCTQLPTSPLLKQSN